MNLPSHIKGLVFDCDGTLADTIAAALARVAGDRQKIQTAFSRRPFLFARRRALARHFTDARQGNKASRSTTLKPRTKRKNAYLPLMSEVEPIHAVVEIAKGELRQNPDGRRVRRHGADHRASAGAFENPASIRRGGDERDGEKSEARAGYFYRSPRGASALTPKFCRAYEDTDLGMQAIRSAGMDAVDCARTSAGN